MFFEAHSYLHLFSVTGPGELELGSLNIQLLVKLANAQGPRWEDPIPVVIVNAPPFNPSWGIGPAFASKAKVTQDGELVVTTP